VKKYFSNTISNNEILINHENRLLKLEKTNLWSKFSTANISSNSRSNPRVFTEQGIYMLATILKSKVATGVSIAIMDRYICKNATLY